MKSRRFSLILLSLAVILAMATTGFAQTGTTGDLAGTAELRQRGNSGANEGPVTRPLHYADDE